MPTNIKVDRLALIKALEAEQRKLTEQFKRDMEKFRLAEALYPKKLAKALESALREVKAGRIPSTNSVYKGGKYTDIPAFPFPEKPKKPAKSSDNLCTLERQIRVLKMCRDETIRVNETSEYVRFVCSL